MSLFKTYVTNYKQLILIGELKWFNEWEEACAGTQCASQSMWVCIELNYCWFFFQLPSNFCCSLHVSFQRQYSLLSVTRYSFLVSPSQFCSHVRSRRDSSFECPCPHLTPLHYPSENALSSPDDRPPSSGVSNPLSTFLPSLQLLS